MYYCSILKLSTQRTKALNYLCELRTITQPSRN